MLTRRTFACLTLGLLAGATACSTEGEGSDKVIRFSAIPDQGSTELKTKFDRVAKYLGEKLGVKVEYVAASDYSASVEAFKKGEVHFAWFGGLTGVQAQDQVDGARAIASGAEDKDFVSYFVAHKDAGITPSDDFPKALAGKRFAFGSKKSTSGRLMPEHFIRTNTGKAPADYFAKVGFLRKHPLTAKGVESGAWDAGALNYQVYDKMVENGELDPKKCVVVWKTPKYFDYNITVRPDLDKDFGDGVTKKLEDALFKMHEAENGTDLCGAFGRSKLVPCTNADLKGIRDVAIQLELLRPKKD